MVPILFENEEIVVVDKPAGLASQPGEGVRDDVVAALERQRGQRLLPVHRLDKETAGCMILAKDALAARRWSELVASKSIHKRYQAWVGGIPEKEGGVIESELEGVKGTQSARTLWRRLETWTLPLSADGAEIALALLELELKTGRMHQIRRHLAGIGLPILADDRHGDFPLNKTLRRLGVKRLMLWARELALPSLPGLPGGASILSSEPPHFAALRDMLADHAAHHPEDMRRDDSHRGDQHS